PDPGRAEGCDLQLLSTEAPITLSYATSTVPRGCVSSGSMDTGHEVHILSVEWSKPTLPGPALRWMSQEPLFPWGACAREGCALPPPPQLRLLLALQDAHLGPGTTAALGPELPMATSQGQLLTWAEEFYGGITSYSELRDPRWVQLLLGEDASSPQGCILQEHFDARLHLEAEVIFYGVKGCSRGHPSTSATHIIHLQPEPSSTITEVNVSLNCPESPASKQFLILQSRANLTWFISVSNCHIQFLASGNYKFASVPWVLIAGERLPDTEQGLVAKAFEKNWSFIASYSAIPTSARISLELQEHHATTRAPVTSIPLGPTADVLPHKLLHTLQPWKCTDETMEIVIARSHLEPIKDVVNITLRDISCQAEKNATHFMLKTPLSHCGTSLEGRGHANNELILSLAKGAVLQSVRVAFQCNIPSELFLRLFPTAAFEAPQTELEVNKEAFVQVPPPSQGPGWGGCPAIPGPVTLTVSPLPLAPTMAALSPCWGAGSTPTSSQPTPLQNTTIFEGVLEVTVKDGWWPPNNRGLGLAAVLGITFGAFLIGALLTAGLWCIYSRTRPTSKLQPVS
ncbi:Endoglin, partial [Egretta garzetta]